MTNQAFVNALRGPEDTPDNINPLSYMRCAICGWTVDTSQPPVRPLPPARRKPEVVVSAEALAAAGTLEKLAF
jgi:hypothetical protein